MEEVCALLGMGSKDIERVKNYLLFDLSFLLNDNAVPPDWKPQTGPWEWPVLGDYTISSPFGTRVDPITGEIRTHEGVDIAGDIGMQVVASRSGTVTHAGWARGFGKLVIIDHGEGLQTYYGHLSDFSVRYGQKVDKGQEVGKMGSTGRSTGPHLHFQVNVNGTPVNPLTFYGG